MLVGMLVGILYVHSWIYPQLLTPSFHWMDTFCFLIWLYIHVSLYANSRGCVLINFMLLFFIFIFFDTRDFYPDETDPYDHKWYWIIIIIITSSWGSIAIKILKRQKFDLFIDLVVFMSWEQDALSVKRDTSWRL